ncbi:MAG TPA: TetR/AcrR family transcriptional regulator [Spirochaetota bacterium]|nr:TetR/AcrR family transcriptional regulator [Spirochaetota bacterium]
MKSRAINRETIKNKIIHAAVTEFSERGFGNARIDSIAAGAGINPSRIYYYIGSKDNLYGHVLTSVFQTVADRLLQPVFLQIHATKDEPDIKLALLIYSFAALNDHIPVRSLRQLCYRDMVEGRNAATVYVKKYLIKYLYAVEDILKDGIGKGIFEVSDSSMLVMSIVSILKNNPADNPVLIRNDSQKKPDIEELYKSLREFVFKSLVPAGKMLVIPQLDDEKKGLCAGLVADLK